MKRVKYFWKVNELILSETVSTFWTKMQMT